MSFTALINISFKLISRVIMQAREKTQKKSSYSSFEEKVKWLSSDKGKSALKQQIQKAKSITDSLKEERQIASELLKEPFTI
jgi:DNA relaxase NicK